MQQKNNTNRRKPKNKSTNQDHRSIDGYGLVDNSEYLMRCQVDTPQDIVSVVWGIAHKYRTHFQTVLDAGAGDGRFSTSGNYDRYVGYEIDVRRRQIPDLPAKAQIVRACAFSDATSERYDLSIGNPPYVRHHDLSDEWRTQISNWIELITGIRPHGLSNAYLYFLWLSFISTSDDGLVVLVVPFEWIVRPAAESLRRYIASQGWSVDVYQFDREPFPRVLTTASVTVIDKKQQSGRIRHFGIDGDGNTRSLRSPTRSNRQSLTYKRRLETAYAQRGLSPGGQKVFVLTEAERAHYGLKVDVDVVRCITSTRHVPQTVAVLTEQVFQQEYVSAGKRCWLIRPVEPLSRQLKYYLDAVPHDERDNFTCNARDIWWKFSLPDAPRLLYSSGFRGHRPKVFVNSVSAISVGSVCGIYASSDAVSRRIEREIRTASLKSEIVAVSKGFMKIEVNQMNAFIQRTIE
ncbi:class I SAM-dependent methyltransferase [Paraburkholderia largidicola]|uniref:class I SAM-dependent methyltransferase n=1 Tax=Paraburkholderia largidicola TaxID=3014751 RepID=UPI0015DA5845|nr:class I SAM-dependent methyltransferase [Paraburkholderia sp. PGU16]